MEKNSKKQNQASLPDRSCDSDSISSSESGQGLVEYALIMALVALVIVAGLTNFATGLGGAFAVSSNAITGSINGAGGS